MHLLLQQMGLGYHLMCNVKCQSNGRLEKLRGLHEMHHGMRNASDAVSRRKKCQWQANQPTFTS